MNSSIQFEMMRVDPESPLRLHGLPAPRQYAAVPDVYVQRLG